MTQYGFYFDSTRCTGCKTCELACKDYNDLGADMLFRKVYNVEGGNWEPSNDATWIQSAFSYNVSIACNCCDAPACAGNCPSGATTKDEETGLVTTNAEVCIGCGTCVSACPYEVPKLDIANKVAKRCNGCIERVREGKKPICVESCPMRALEFDDIDALVEKYGDLRQIAPLPSPDQTSPNLVIKASPATADEYIENAFVANEKEIA